MSKWYGLVDLWHFKILHSKVKSQHAHPQLIILNSSFITKKSPHIKQGRF